MKDIYNFIIESNENIENNIINTKSLNEKELNRIKKYLIKKSNSKIAGQWIYALKQLIDLNLEIIFSIKDMCVKEVETKDKETQMKDWYNAYIIKNAKIKNKTYKIQWQTNEGYEFWIVLDDKNKFKCYLQDIKS